MGGHASYLDEDQPHHWTGLTGVLGEWTYPEGRPWTEEGKNWPGWEFYPLFYVFASTR